MVEQSNTRHRHFHAIIITTLRNLRILNTSTWLGHIRNTHLGSVIDRIPKGEERIRTNRNTTRLLHKLILLTRGKWFGDGIKLCLPPRAFLIGKVSLNVPHTGIDAILSFHALLEFKAQHLGMLTEVPSRDLAAGELDAIDARLLSGAYADHHAVLGKSHRVGLRVLDANARHDHVANGAFGQCIDSSLGNNILRHVLFRNNDIVPLLTKCHSIHLTILDRIRHKVRLGFQHNKLATLLGFQNGQRLGSISRRDDTIAHLLLQNHGRVLIDNVAHCGEISKGTHGIGISRTKVCQCGGR
mmetsp:Transcript_6765/g.15424  ORF Transcript_6765/g.15424 Transcript_6765/m.15424 type:complete len:299 (-) Transcript_6765:1036-1932(-)